MLTANQNQIDKQQIIEQLNQYLSTADIALWS